jgi:hypothetical protein
MILPLEDMRISCAVNSIFWKKTRRRVTSSAGLLHSGAYLNVLSTKVGAAQLSLFGPQMNSDLRQLRVGE